LFGFDVKFVFEDEVYIVMVNSRCATEHTAQWIDIREKEKEKKEKEGKPTNRLDQKFVPS
jgi:predicted ATP-grasp superfamily ATP-dependent carboligase